MTQDIVEAHTHSIRHRAEILASEQCGCFYCLALFPPMAIVEWVNEPVGSGQTALCPQCGIDSVIGSASGYPVASEFLKALRDHWF